MQLTDSSSQSPVAAAPEVAPAESATIQQCDECGAPVDKDQRYCVSCGAHRRHVNDPAARYLSQATSRSRTSKVAATARRTPRGGARSRGLALAIAIAIIPVAAAAGVIAGRSSNNNDAKLIQALDRRQSAAAATSTTTVPTAAAASASTHTKVVVHAKAKHHAKKSASTATPSVKNAGKVISKTANGSAQQITGFKPTQSQEQQGAAATKQVQKSTGKSYVTGQNNLPSQVVVP
jgi:hypothetical protein